MSRYASREMTEGLSKLITGVAGFKRGEENHQRCMDYALSMIFNATYPETYKAQVKNDVDALVEKFTINVESERARNLQAAFEKLFELADRMDTENKTNIIKVARFLILMTNHSSIWGSSCGVIREEAIQATEDIDWHAYLNEGWDRESVEDFDSDLSDWSDHSQSDVEPVTQVEQFSSQLATEEESESSSDFLTSVEVGTSNVATLAKESGSAAEECNESWKASDPGYRYSKIKVNSKFPAPLLAELCSSHSALRILSEYAVVREIIMVLRDNSACGLVFKKEGHKYNVLGDVTVCSLSPEMFRSVLGSVLPALSMLSKIHAFVGKMLPNSMHNSFHHPPKTYQAYAAGLELVFRRQNVFLLRLEDRVKSQDDIMTINSCLDALHPWFKFLYEVYRVHEAATFEKYHIQQYWVCSCKLLSVLWLEAERNPTLGISSVVFSLLLISLKPYLDITENWFLFGSLDDPHEEFLISGEVAEADNNLDGDYILHPFEQSLVDLGVVPMPLLKIMANKGLTVGRSICLLRGLDCMEQAPKSLDNVSIYEELIAMLRAGLMPSDKRDDFLLIDVVEPVQEERKVGSEGQADALEQYTLDYILTTSDAHLLEAYGDTLNLGLETDHSEEQFSFGEFKLPFSSTDLCPVQSLNHVLCESVERILESRVRGVGKLAKELLRSKCKISDHLSAVHSVAFFQVFSMHEFCSFLNEEIRKEENWHGWATWVLLTNKLQVCLNEQHFEWSHLFSIRVAADFEPDAVAELTEGFPLMQLINRLSLQYSMNWPTNLVLNSANMRLYNDIFRFFLKIKCALSSLQRVTLSDCRSVRGGNAELSHRLWLLRSWVLFVLGSVHEHMLSNILMDMKQQLDERLERASDFHSALQAHERFVRRSHFSCLLNAKHAAAQEHIMEIVGQAMVICDAFEKGSIEADVVENMELKLNLALNFLAIFFDAISTSVNSVHLKGIAIALNEKAPSF